MNEACSASALTHSPSGGLRNDDSYVPASAKVRREGDGLRSNQPTHLPPGNRSSLAIGEASDGLSITLGVRHCIGRLADFAAGQMAYLP
jgi:hypothetical protein